MLSSKTCRRALSLCALLASSTLTAAQNPFQNPNGAGAQPPVGTAVVAGRVIDGVTGRGIAGATIGGFVRTRTGPPVTDAQGRFALSQLQAGGYSFAATAPGYVPASTLARVTRVRLQDGERVLDLEFRLYPTASLAGTVADAGGLPIVGATVVAMRQGISTQERLAARTDDRGEYRFTDLSPGDYVLCACLRDDIPFDGVVLSALASQPANLIALAAKAVMAGSDVAELAHSLNTFAPTFYPSAAAIADARHLTLAPGDDRTGVNISAPTVPAVRVSGRIVGAAAPMNWSALKLIPAADAGTANPITGVSPTVMQPDGRFDFAMVPPGPYVLRASVPMSGSNLGPTGTITRLLGNRSLSTPDSNVSAGNGRLFGELSIAVGADGLMDVVVPVTAGPTIAGRVESTTPAPINGRPSPAQNILSFVSLADDGVGAFGETTVNPSASGAFVSPPLPPGKYALRGLVSSVLSAKWRGVEIKGHPFDLDANGMADLVVTLGAPQVGTLNGRAPAALHSVAVIFPADRTQWTYPQAAEALRFVTTPIAKDGSFSASLEAGDYLVAVVPEMQGDTWMSAASMAALARTAAAATVAARGTTMIEVK